MPSLDLRPIGPRPRPWAWLFLVCLVWLALAAVAGARPSRRQVVNDLKRGLELMHQGQNEPALEFSERVVGAAPNLYPGYAARGLIRLEMSRRLAGEIFRLQEEAKAAPERAAEWNPKIEALQARNRSTLRLSLADHDKALKIAPDKVHVRAFRGSVHRLLQQFDASVADFSWVLKRQPKDPQLYRDRGLAYLEKAKLLGETQARPDASNAEMLAVLRPAVELAIADFSRAVDLEGQNAANYILRANALVRNAQVDRALSDLAWAVSFAPREPASYLLRASIYENLALVCRQQGNTVKQRDLERLRQADLAEAARLLQGAGGAESGRR